LGDAKGQVISWWFYRTLFKQCVGMIREMVPHWANKAVNRSGEPSVFTNQGFWPPPGYLER
jgi:hypothetical protein